MQRFNFCFIMIFSALSLLVSLSVPTVLGNEPSLDQTKGAAAKGNAQSEKDSENSKNRDQIAKDTERNAEAIANVPRKKERKKAKGQSNTGGKETEGTKAINKFEGDSVLKSRYQQNGVPLEVDTD